MQTINPDRQSNNPVPDASISRVNRLLVFTVKTVWKGFKGLFHIAVRLPGLFAAANRAPRNKDAKLRKSKKP